MGRRSKRKYEIRRKGEERREGGGLREATASSAGPDDTPEAV